jgi:predicted esterase
MESGTGFIFSCVSQNPGRRPSLSMRMTVMISAILCLGAASAFAETGGSSLYTVAGTESEGSVQVLSIDFQSAESPSQSHAFLVRPGSGGTGSAILYLHLLGPGGTSTQFLSEAKTLAAKGVVCLLPQGRVPWHETWTGDSKDLARGQSQMAEYRMAIEILRHEPGVTPGGIVLVGHDYGAMYGLCLMADDPGIKAGAFLAFAPRYSDWIAYFPGDNHLPKDQYDRLMGPLDPMKALSRIADRPVFLQFARSDIYVSEKTISMIQAAAGPRMVFDVVDAEGTHHENLHRMGAARRGAWLEQQLGTP